MPLIGQGGTKFLLLIKIIPAFSHTPSPFDTLNSMGTICGERTRKRRSMKTGSSIVGSSSECKSALERHLGFMNMEGNIRSSCWRLKVSLDEKFTENRRFLHDDHYEHFAEVIPCGTRGNIFRFVKVGPKSS